ncbi:GNAT family N-acetyltransferase [Methylocapsa polymorpha]|uniref:GNAT family N-acetyltransferase n=1 Tax=Methylocapsa polymorpha TaxID=3080828 RepID=A0ABZ0HS03_9HYPH|nr:GNAT family N-acetyltransferase [Methylocapsa sp. RX1]
MARRIGVRASPIRVRPARLEDLAAIEAIEAAVFAVDRLSRRSLRYFLKSKTALFLVLDVNNHVAGYSLMSFRQGSLSPRLYSIALDPVEQGRGLGRFLLGASERAAKARGAVAMRLEVRVDNARAIELYKKNGYRSFAAVEDYYQDGAAALRFEKEFAQDGEAEPARIIRADPL